MGHPVRIRGDILAEGQLIVAVVQSGRELQAKCHGGCVVLGPEMIKLNDCPPLEELSPQFPPPEACA